MKTSVKTKGIPGVFEIMSDFQSYEIQNWLDTTPPNVARALFETGAKLESQLATLKSQRDELAEALKAALAEMDAFQKYWTSPNMNLKCSESKAQEAARALLAKLEGGGK